MTEHEAEPATAVLVANLANLTHSTERLEQYQDAIGDLDPQDAAGAIALIQDLKARLGQVEAQATMVLGKAIGVTTGDLPDGRQFTLKRSQDRTAWDHEDWKRDARRAIVNDFTKPGDTIYEGVVTADGEVVALGPILHAAIAQAQEVHGSTAPRSTALKRLGLYASNYCTSSPGGWRLNAIRPETPTTTTEEK